MKKNKMGIATRLTLGTCALLALLAISVIMSLDRLDRLNAMTDRIASQDWKKAALANEVMVLMSANARETFLLFHTDDRRPGLLRIDQNKTLITQRLEELNTLLYRPEGQALMAEIKALRTPYVQAFSKVPGLLDAGSRDEASAAMSAQVTPALETLLAAVDKLVRLQGRILDESALEAKAIYDASRLQMLLALAVAVVVGCAVSVWVVRSVTVPLGGEPEEVRQIAESIALGDLTSTLKLKAGDEHSLMVAMSRMQGNLRKIVVELHDSAASMAAAAQQLAATSTQVATANSAQAEASASMAAAVEQMTVSVSQVSDRAQETHGATSAAGARSKDGSRVIQDTLAEMQQVSLIFGEAAQTIQRMGGKSQEISGIVQVIKDVADQTNLLALNAAIEAARAGEQGRGFAVVADEVLKLAERTASATTEITAMIGAVQSSAQDAVGTMQLAVERVDAGMEKARRASASMEEISAGADHVVGMVNEISNALREQSFASNDISANVEKIAHMAEENGAATREVAEIAGSLESMAASTRQAVGRFRVA